MYFGCALEKEDDHALWVSKNKSVLTQVWETTVKLKGILAKNNNCAFRLFCKFL